MIYASEGSDVPKILRFLRENYIKENAVWEPMSFDDVPPHEELLQSVGDLVISNAASEDVPMIEHEEPHASDPEDIPAQTDRNIDIGSYAQGIKDGADAVVSQIERFLKARRQMGSTIELTVKDGNTLSIKQCKRRKRRSASPITDSQRYRQSIVGIN